MTIEKDGYRLVHKNTLKDVNVGEELPDFRGDAGVIEGGYPPTHEGSTGRVQIKDRLSTLFPSVFGLEWIKT